MDDFFDKKDDPMLSGGFPSNEDDVFEGDGQKTYAELNNVNSSNILSSVRLMQEASEPWLMGCGGEGCAFPIEANTATVDYDRPGDSVTQPSPHSSPSSPIQSGDDAAGRSSSDPPSPSPSEEKRGKGRPRKMGDDAPTVAAANARKRRAREREQKALMLRKIKTLPQENEALKTENNKLKRENRELKRENKELKKQLNECTSGKPPLVHPIYHAQGPTTGWEGEELFNECTSGNLLPVLPADYSQGPTSGLEG